MTTDNNKYEAWSKLGPFCLKCGKLAASFEIFPMANGTFDGKIGCDACDETYHLTYDGKHWRLLEEEK